jgi:hypothetical protein
VPYADQERCTQPRQPEVGVAAPEQFSQPYDDRGIGVDDFF